MYDNTTLKIIATILIVGGMAVLGLIAWALYNDNKDYQNSQAILIINPATMTYRWSTPKQVKQNKNTLPELGNKYHIKILIEDTYEKETK